MEHRLLVAKGPCFEILWAGKYDLVWAKESMEI